MKTFKQHVKEAHSGYMGDGQGVGVAVQNSIEDGNISAANIHDPEVLKQVNAFVGSIAEREYLSPQKAVNELKENISSSLGLHLSKMLESMSDRGPDSAGLAIYGKPIAKKAKIMVQSQSPSNDFKALKKYLSSKRTIPFSLTTQSTHAVIKLDIKNDKLVFSDTKKTEKV